MRARGGVRYQYYESSAQSYGVEEEERQQRALQKQDCLQLKARKWRIIQMLLTYMRAKIVRNFLPGSLDVNTSPIF